MGDPQNGLYRMDNPIEMDDLGLSSTLILGNLHFINRADL